MTWKKKHNLESFTARKRQRASGDPLTDGGFLGYDSLTGPRHLLHLPGQCMHLGPYELLTQLSVSSDGASFQARDTRSGELAELRDLSSARRDPSRWRWLGRRLRLAKLLQHPAARRVHELALDQEPPWIALEWLANPPAPAGALPAALPLPVPQAVALVQSVAAALARSHQLGLAHGRLGRNSFWFNGNGLVKVDFTALAGENRQGDEGMFAPPEGADPQTPQFSADVYSVGRLLFWLLTGQADSQVAVDGNCLAPESAELLRQLKTDQTLALELLLHDCLSPEPLDRPSAQELADRLAALSAALQGAESSQPFERSNPGSVATKLAVADAARSPSPRRTAAPGKQLGRFQLKEQLGQGGMGTVFRATDTADGSVVAIKVLRAELTTEPDALRRFRKEARLLGEIRHPNVARLLEMNQDDQGIHYLVIEFADGTDLAQELARRRRFDERTSLMMLAEVARGLEDAHERGIVHRDIKPSNICLLAGAAANGSALRLKLLDFGLARHVVETASLEVTQAGTVLGTPLYMAPEQWLRQSIDPRTDVYALGATLFHLLAGEPPFASDHPTGLLGLHCHQPAPPVTQRNPEVSEATAQIVAKCLAKAPADRYANAGALLRDLERVLRGEPASIVAHPQLPVCDPRRVFHFDWVMDLQSSPAALWPHVSNTERLNRAVGLPAVHFTAQVAADGVRRFGEFKKAGFTNVWQEHPFEWVEGRRMGVLREYSQGVFKWLATMTELEAQVGGGTRLTHRVRVEPRGLVGRMVAAIEVGRRGRKAVERVYQRIDAFLTQQSGSQPLTDPFEEPQRLAAIQQQRLDSLLQGLVRNGVTPAVAAALGDYLAQAPGQELARIRPLALARRLGLDADAVVAACLWGARLGLFVLLWDILCPVCRVAAEVKDTLREVSAHAHCQACNLDFDLDFANSVELICRIHPDIRASELGTWCIGGPVHFPHVAAQARVAAGERIELELALPEGAYRLRGPQLPWTVNLPVQAGGAASRWEIALTSGPPANGFSLKPGRQVLVLHNAGEFELLVRLERLAGRADALTAARASALALFRELFPAEALSPGQLVSVAHVTLLLTQLQGARTLYQKHGDARAFVLVQEHFRVLEECIRRHGGALVKTVGEGIVAVFHQAVTAVRAAWLMPKLLADNDATRDLHLRIGVHGGPALTATFNGQLDYFGATVNTANELLDLIQGGDLLLTNPVAADPQVARLLADWDLRGELVELELPGEPLGLAHRFVLPR